MSVKQILRHIVGRDIRVVVTAWDFAELNDSPQLLILEPECSGLKMTDLPDTEPLGHSKCRAGVHLELDLDDNVLVLGQGFNSRSFLSRLQSRVEFRPRRRQTMFVCVWNTT